MITFVMLLPAAPVQLPFRAPAPFGVEKKKSPFKMGNLQLEEKEFFRIGAFCSENLKRDPS